MSNKLHIGFTGFAGAGKDYVADLITKELESDGFVVDRIPWARGVREEIEFAVMGHWEGEGGTLDKLYAKPTEKTMIRPLLQWWGTDFRRAQDPDYWVKWGMEAADESDADVILFTDTRFYNEANAVTDKGGLIINVQASHAVRYLRIGDVPAHPSEKFANDLPYDFRIYNHFGGPSLSAVMSDIAVRLVST